MTGNETRINEIRARFTAATEGPWQRYPEYGPNFFANTTGGHLRGIGDLNFGEGDQAEADEALVTNAQQDIAFLLDRIAELEQAMTGIRHIHKDSPMGPCPVCVNADAMARGDDGTVPYPCPTARLAGAKDCDPPSSRESADA